MGQGRYTYGEGDVADRRLADIASYFDVSSEAFVRRQAPAPITLAVDLGCGPGHTTRMLHRSAGARLTVGLDSSHDFLRRAAARLPQCRFVRCDVRRPVLPCAPDLAYCRFVLSHLPDPPSVLDRWADNLARGGRLLVDELEDIETDLPVFRRYLEVGGRLVASQGARLWVGPALSGAAYRSRILLSETVRLQVPNRTAASWFHPNTVTVWEREPAVLTAIGAGERREIADQLARIRDTGHPDGHAVWVMRRIVAAAGS